MLFQKFASYPTLGNEYLRVSFSILSMTRYAHLKDIDAQLKRSKFLFVLILLHILLSVNGSTFKSINGDERGYYSYAARCLKGNAVRSSKWDDSKTSILSIGLLPRAITQLFNTDLKKNDGGNSDLLNGRLIVLCFSIVALVYLWLLLKKLDLPYAMLAFPFAIIDPLWLSYATLFISDLPVGMFTIALVYHGWAYFTEQKLKHLIGASVLMGLGIACKFSFIPAVAGLMLAFLIIGYKQLFQSNQIMGIIKKSALAVCIILLTINLCYPFDQRFTSLHDHELQSAKFRELEKTWVGSVPIPLPHNVVQAMDMLSFHSDPNLPDEHRTFYGGPYLFNKFYFNDGPKWYYYWVLLILKTPVFPLILFFLGLITLVFGVYKNKLAFIAAFTFLFYFFFSGLFNQFQIGARHMLAVQPLLFITVGVGISQLAKWLERLSFHRVFICGALWTILSVGYFFPFMLPYTNEFIRDKKTAHWYIGEGAIDYHQSEDYLATFLKNHPEFSYPTADQPHTGNFAITTSSLWGQTFIEKNPLAIKLWRRKPDEIRQYAVLIYKNVQ